MSRRNQQKGRQKPELYFFQCVWPALASNLVWLASARFPYSTITTMIACETHRTPAMHVNSIVRVTEAFKRVLSLTLISSVRILQGHTAEDVAMFNR